MGFINDPLNTSGMFDAFLSLFFPSICLSCSKSLLNGEDCICTYCRYHLPQTIYHLEKENPLIQHFWGKVPIHSAAAYYFFQKGEKVQHLLHQLKYQGRKEIGVKLGEIYGFDLKQSTLFNTVDLVIPVPLYLKKEKKRGYNQSTTFAQGLSKSMGITTDTDTLARVKHSETQTKKNRFSRWENVHEIFVIREGIHLENKHVLLVDDVITTGATIEACAQELNKIKNIKISIASIACA